MGGVTFKPTERLDFGVDVVWNDVEASLDPFAIEVPERFINANQFYDFTSTHTFSDLALARTEAGLRATYRFGAGTWIDLGYRYADVDDDAPYIENLTGSLDYVTLAFGKRF